jgi:uncharacterized glyoxalase superfamily protein PhnB
MEPVMASRPTISPGIWYRDPRAAIAWLEQAFGFEARLVVDDGAGGVMHSELWIQDGCVMVMGPPSGAAISPSMFGGRASQSVHVQLADGLDAHCERARSFGARIGREPETQPYGDRVYTCLDLEDHPWSFGQTMIAMTPGEMAVATGHAITAKA